MKRIGLMLVVLTCFLPFQTFALQVVETGLISVEGQEIEHFYTFDHSGTVSFNIAAFERAYNVWGDPAVDHADWLKGEPADEPYTYTGYDFDGDGTFSNLFDAKIILHRNIDGAWEFVAEAEDDIEYDADTGDETGKPTAAGAADGSIVDIDPYWSDFLDAGDYRLTVSAAFYGAGTDTLLPSYDEYLLTGYYALTVISPDGGTPSFGGSGGQPPAVPEPSTVVLLGSGLAALWFGRRKFSK